jgi:glycosyltransferase involved in cell wall biosynthesis
MKISIIVGVFNGAKTLEATIDSVVAQTHPDVELLIQDGGSTDGTIALLEKRDADLAYWRTERDTGLYDAWNRVLPHATGDYIAFLGCDDALATPYVLATLVSAIRDDRPDLVCSLNAHVDARGRFIRPFGKPWTWQGGMTRAQVIAHPGMLHRRDLFTEHGAFDASYRIAGDYEWLLRLGPTCRTTFVDQITVRMGDGGMSHTRVRTTWDEVRRAQTKHFTAATATKNYLGNVARYALRRIRGRR